MDNEVFKIEATPDNYDEFLNSVKAVARKYIPRGCRTEYISGLSRDSKKLLTTYEKLFYTDPFAEDTIAAGEKLLEVIAETRREK